MSYICWSVKESKCHDNDDWEILNYASAQYLDPSSIDGGETWFERSCPWRYPINVAYRSRTSCTTSSDHGIVPLDNISQIHFKFILYTKKNFSLYIRCFYLLIHALFHSFIYVFAYSCIDLCNCLCSHVFVCVFVCVCLFMYLII